MEKVEVLVVEDEWITASDVKTSLEKQNYAVCATVTTGEEAIQTAIELHPDLVLIDIILQGEIDGIQAAQQIQTRCNIPVVFLLADFDREILERANATQPFGYLLKPFDERELNTTIQVALSRHKASVELHSQLATVVESSKDSTQNAIASSTVTRNLTQRQRTEQLLQQQQFLLSSLIERSQDLIAVLDRDFRYITFNSAYKSEFLKIFGREIEIGTSLIEALAHLPEEQTKAVGIWQRGLSGEEFTLIQQLGDSTRERHYYEITFSSIRDENGQLLGAAHIAKDISDRKQTEVALRASKEQLQLVLEGSGDGWWDWNIATGDVTRSPRWGQMLGYEAGELPEDYSTWERLLHPDDKPWVLQLLNAHLKNSAVSYCCDYRLLTKSGEWKWIANYGKVVVRDRQGKPLRMSGIHRDITERKQIEQEREKLLLQIEYERARLEAVLKQMPAAILIIEAPSGQVILSNDKVESMLRHPIPPGERLEDLAQYSAIHPDGRPYTAEEYPIARSVLTGEVVINEEMHYNKGDGNQAILALYSSPVRDTKGRIIASVASAFDITDRKRAEAALKRSEASLAEAQKIAHVGSWEFDLATQTITWSDELFRIYGLDPQQGTPSYSQHLQQFFAEDRVVLEKSIDAALHEGKAYQFDYKWLCPDGSLRYLAASGKPIVNDTGEVVGLFGTVLDISDRKKAELEIEYSRDLNQAIFNESADALFLVNPETWLIFDCNLRAVKLFEATSKDELIGISGHTLQRQPLTAQELVAISQELDATGVWSRELECVTKTGNRFWGNLAAKQINVAGRAIHLVRLTDITQRKEAEKALEFQAVITRNMAEGVCLIRAVDWTIVYANSKFETLFGYGAGELNGKSVSILNYNDENTSAEDTVRRIVRDINNDGAASCEIHNVKKDGTPFWCQATVSQFEHPDYGMVYVAVQHDITEQKQAQEQIKASLKEKEVLLKEIHHRVKNNLQIVSSLLQMQSRRTQEREASLILQDSQNRIASIALVHEKLYRSENLANIDFAQYIPDLTIHLFDTYKVSSNNVTLKTQVENIFLEIDTAIPCGLIINELVSNSLKYAFPNKRKGEIQVNFHADSTGTMRLIVQDNGIGIPEEFDIETTSSLGLTLVQGLVDQLEGTLELNRSRGTQFSIQWQHLSVNSEQ